MKGTFTGLDFVSLTTRYKPYQNFKAEFVYEVNEEDISMSTSKTLSSLCGVTNLRLITEVSPNMELGFEHRWDLLDNTTALVLALQITPTEDTILQAKIDSTGELEATATYTGYENWEVAATTLMHLDGFNECVPDLGISLQYFI